MRPVTLADLEMALRVLLQVDARSQAEMASALVARAHQADAFRQDKGQGHPRYGTGTLMSAAMSYPVAPRPDWVRLAELRSFQFLLSALEAHFQHHER